MSATPVVPVPPAVGAGVTVPSAFVTDLASRWSPEELAGHRTAAGHLKAIALGAFAHVKDALARGEAPTEYSVQQWVLQAMARAGLSTTDPPIVGVGPNAANPHYEPKAGADSPVRRGAVLLLDLWGGVRIDTVYADQTWMAFVGSDAPDEVRRVWQVVRDARDEAVTVLRNRWRGAQSVTGADLDDAARGVIRAAGFEQYFVHRTGHSIDRDLHGSGPHLDNYETHDDRLLAAGIGFSVEPGVYLTGRFGVRSEIIVVLHAAGPEVTPEGPQQDLICLDV